MFGFPFGGYGFGFPGFYRPFPFYGGFGYGFARPFGFGFPFFF